MSDFLLADAFPQRRWRKVFAEKEKKQPPQKKKKANVSAVFVAAERWISADERWITGSPLGGQRASLAVPLPEWSAGGGSEDLFSVEGRR